MDTTMKRKLILWLMLSIATIIQGQSGLDPFNQTLLLRDSTSTTDSIPLISGLVPLALLINDDSMKVASAVTFEVSFGNSSTRRWYTVCKEGDSIAYTIGIPTDTCIIPLDPRNFATLFSGPSQFDRIWFRLRFTVKHDGDQHFILRQRAL